MFNMRRKWITSADAECGIAGKYETPQAKHVAWPSCTWLLLIFFPFPMGHPMSAGCIMHYGIMWVCGVSYFPAIPHSASADVIHFRLMLNIHSVPDR